MITAVSSVVLLGAGAAEAKQDPCNSHACHVRVAHKQAKKKKIRVTAPYRGWLARLRGCESGGNYRAVDATGSFFGAYQFTLGTWRGAGGWGMPHLAARLEQDYRAVRWRLRIGNPHQPAGWPVCG